MIVLFVKLDVYFLINVRGSSTSQASYKEKAQR